MKAVLIDCYLDIDATLVETAKREALFCYEGYRAYQPLNVYWTEAEFLVDTEFRDGNVPANRDLLRVFKEASGNLPETVNKMRLRADAAGYSHDLLAHCDKGDNERFGRIEFAIGCPVTEAFKREVHILPREEWKRLDARREKAEVGYVPDEPAHSKRGQSYRFLAIREVLRQPVLPGMDLPFQTVACEGVQYKLHGLVSNMDAEGGRLIASLRQERRGPCSLEERSHGREAPLGELRGECGVVVDERRSLQPEC